MDTAPNAPATGTPGRARPALPVLEREASLEALASAVSSARSGRGRLVLLSGEAGVGKTTVVRQLVDRQAECRVLLGACDPTETPRPLGPLLDMAEQLGPELAGRLAGAPPRAELFAAVLAALDGAAPATIAVFEDLHWADQATLDLVRFVGRRIDRCRLVAVATFRDDQLAPDHPLAVLLGDLATAPGVERIGLPPLSLDAIRTLAAGTGLDADAVFRGTGGNPFFATEVLAAGTLEVPATVRDAVLARVLRLAEPTQECLQAAAAIGPRLEPALLAAVLDAAGTPRWTTREAVLTGLLQWRGQVLTFRHELAQLAIAEATPSRRRQQLHAAILALLRTSPIQPDSAPALVGHAEAAGDDAAVFEFAPLAARRAGELSAHREAAALWGKALAVATRRPAAVRAELTERQATERYLSGELGPAADAHQAAAALWHEAGDRIAEGRNLTRVSALSFLAGRQAEVEPAGDAALACLEAEPPSRELAMAYDSRSRLRFMTQDAVAAAEWADRSRAVAEALDEPETVLEATVSGAAARLLDGDEDAHAELATARKAALGRGLPDLAARATLYLGWLPVLQRRYDGVAEFLDEGMAYAVEHELEYWQLLISSARVRWCLEQGRWDEVEPGAQAVLAHREAVSLSTAQVLASVGRLRARRGDDPAGPLDEALAVTDRHPRVEAVALVRAARAEAAWLAGDLDRALAEVRAALATEIGVRNPWWVGELAFWAYRAGGTTALDHPGLGHPAAGPYRLSVSGEWAAAARDWEHRGCPYERALALTDANDPAAVIDAVASLDRLGARAAAAEARRRLRALGVRSIPRGPRPSTAANRAGLTQREREVLAQVSRGLSNAEIAGRLFLSEKTVERHLSATYRKLMVSTRADAVSAARSLGALPAE